MAAPNAPKMTATDRYIPPGTREVYNVPTIAASTGIPTLQELNAGTNVTAEIPPDGLEGFGTEGEDKEVPDLSSRVVGKIPGMINVQDASIKTYASKTSTDARQLWTDGLKTNIVIFPEGTTGGRMNVFLGRVKNTNVDNGGDDAASVTSGFSIARVVKDVAIPTV